MKDDVIILDEVSAPRGEEDSIRENGDGSKTISLLYPVSYRLRQGSMDRQEVLSEITIRRPTGADLRDISKIKDSIEQGVRTFVLLSGQPAAIFDKLDLDDINLISGVIEGFLSRSPATGKTS